MGTWKKLLLAALAAATIGGGANLAAMAASSPATRPAVDVKGPCDEAEHANDPACRGVVQIPEDRRDAGEPAEDRRDVREPGEDLRGPCDEAEHANDPACRGVDDRQVGNEAGEEDRVDNSGPGSMNSGPSENSGPSDDSGSGSSGSGSSGSGREDHDGHGGGD